MNSFNPRKIASLLLAGAALVVFQVAAVQKAYAHYPIVSATATCVKGAPFINYTITSWDPGSTQSALYGAHDGDNPDVEVLFNGVVVPAATGAFLPGTIPPDQFSGSQPAPQGVTTVHVSAITVGTWGDNYPGGENSDWDLLSMDVNLPAACSPPADGRFTGGGKDVITNALFPVSGMVTLTKGFEVECDLDPAHENLELNWHPPTGANFHMDKITGATCSYQGPPNPPTANVNRIDATGTGSYNGVEGYTVMFTLIDNGEPGGGNDAAGFIVYETANPANVVLNVPIQSVGTGNIQAHLDTGH